MPRWPEKKSHKNRHSCYILKYHLILVTKYRNPVITGIVKEDLIDLIKSIAGIKWGCNIIAINSESLSPVFFLSSRSGFQASDR